MNSTRRRAGALALAQALLIAGAAVAVEKPVARANPRADVAQAKALASRPAPERPALPLGPGAADLAPVTRGAIAAGLPRPTHAPHQGTKVAVRRFPQAVGDSPLVVLYDNGPLVNCPGCGAGGADGSVLQVTALGMNTLGFGHQFTLGYRMADDFTIADAGGWDIDTITFYAYQTGSGTTSTMTGVYLQIWDGPPNAGGTVVWGDLTTNRLTNTSWSNIYRYSDTTPGTTRPIMADVATVGAHLDPGTYWLDWTTAGSLASGPWAPPITINGLSTTGNALQYTTAWADALDTGTSTPQGLPFVIEGTLSVPLTLDKTVGTVPGDCAVTDSITVPYGTPVYYCFTVTNNSGMTLNFHDLVDDHLGTILNNENVVLASGSSYQVIVGDTAVATVTNTATWTARDVNPGYTADDTIAYDFQDISGTGTPVALTDDSVSGPLPIGFPFSFYGVSYTDAYLSSNGFLTFLPGQPNGCCTGQPIPTAATPNGIVAGWWEDLNPTAGGTIQYETLGSAPDRVFIAQFTAVPHYPSGNLVTMQYKLFEGTNVVEVHYQAAPSDGGTNSAGVENETGTIGTQYYLGTASLPADLAVRYSLASNNEFNASDSATVTVVVPDIQVTPGSLTSLLPPNTTDTQQLAIHNAGTADLNWTIDEAAPPIIGDLQHTPLLVLYDNGPLVNCAGCGPGGADESRLQDSSLGLNLYGFGHQFALGYRMADDFTIADAGGWDIDTITFFAYQTGSTTSSTITGVYLQIWDGPPDGGGTVIWGDMTTNRLANSTWSNIYRTLESAPGDTSRPIMADVATVGTHLGPGTYWLDWSTDGTLASGPWAPPITINGQSTTGNALQYTSSWAAALDSGTGTPQGMPFVIEGSSSPCYAPSDLPWLSISPTAGATVPGDTSMVDVTFDSTGMTPGESFSGLVCVFSDDPDTGLVEVPVTMTVDSMPFIGDFETGDTSQWSFVVP